MERTITNQSKDIASSRQMYETVVKDDSIEIIAYKFVDGGTTVETAQDTSVVADKYLTLDAYLTRSLDEIAEGLMTIKPEFTTKEDVQVLEDRVTVKITT